MSDETVVYKLRLDPAKMAKLQAIARELAAESESPYGWADVVRLAVDKFLHRVACVEAAEK
jgi:hypothetical protein